MSSGSCERLGIIHIDSLQGRGGDGNVILARDRCLLPSFGAYKIGIALQFPEPRTGSFKSIFWAHKDSKDDFWCQIDNYHRQLLRPILVDPVTLTKVFFNILRGPSVQEANARISELYQSLCRDQAILHMGETISVECWNNTSDMGLQLAEYTWELQIALTEPVCQGCVAFDLTQFVFLSVEGYSAQPHPRSPTISPTIRPDTLRELGESYLENWVVQDQDRGMCISDTTLQLSARGVRSLDRSVICAESVGDRYLLSSSTSEASLLATAADLAHLGLFAGEWAIVSPPLGRSDRLVKMQTLRDDISENQVVASPILFHNIHSLDDPSPSIVCLRSVSNGPPTLPIPTAKSITVARVLSSTSTDRAFEQLLAISLSDFFLTCDRFFKEGDIFSVPLQCDHIRLAAAQISTKDDLHLDSRLNLNQFSRTPSTTPLQAHFKISQAEINSVNLEHNDDLYLAVSTGELGFWVRHQETRVTQSGVEHSRCPQRETLLFEDLDQSKTRLHSLLGAFVQGGALKYEMRPTILLSGPSGAGKSYACRSTAESLGLHFFEIDCYDLLSDDEIKAQALLSARVERACRSSPSVVLLRHIECLTPPRQSALLPESPFVEILRICIEEIQGIWNLTGFPPILVATCEDETRLSVQLAALFKHQVAFEAPSESRRFEIIKSLLCDTEIAPDVSLRGFSLQTAAFTALDLEICVGHAKLYAFERAAEERCRYAKEEDICFSGIALLQIDFDRALAKSREAFSQNVNAPKIPSVTWEDVGGLAGVKADILDTVQLPMDHPELFAEGIKKRSGILLYGPPGTGKTMLAKAVATSCSLNFFSVKGPELLNMYIGESEGNVRRVFQRARDASPCVIFFDELDSIAPARGNQGDSGGVMDRIASQLLAELDTISGTSSQTNVFVIGATNRPDLLDPALLRPGRFDRMLYLGVCETHEAQADIIRALTRKFRLAPDVSVEDIASRCSFNYTGADFYALCSDALLNAMSRRAQEVDDEIASLNAARECSRPTLTPQYYLSEVISPSELEFTVGIQDFDKASKNLVPSVSETEMVHYRQVQERFGTGLT